MRSASITARVRGWSTNSRTQPSLSARSASVVGRQPAPAALDEDVRELGDRHREVRAGRRRGPGPPASAYAARTTPARRGSAAQYSTRIRASSWDGSARPALSKSKTQRPADRRRSGRCRPRGRDGRCGGRGAGRRATPPWRPAPGRAHRARRRTARSRARSAPTSSDQRAAPTGSVVPGVDADVPAKSTRWRLATNRPTVHRVEVRVRVAQVHPGVTTLTPSAITSPAGVRRGAGVGTPAASAASWKAAPSISSASSAAGTSPTCLTAQLPDSASSRQIEPSRPLATGPSESRPHDPRSNAARIDGTSRRS